MWNYFGTYHYATISLHLNRKQTVNKLVSLLNLLQYCMQFLFHVMLRIREVSLLQPHFLNVYFPSFSTFLLDVELKTEQFLC